MFSRIRLVIVLIFGFMFRCIVENIFIGKVVELGLEMKLVSIRLFSDRVKDIMLFVVSEGVIIGMVISRNIFQGLVFRFIVVFLIDRLSLCRCVDIIIVMQDEQKLVWVIQMVMIFCFCGQLISCVMVMNNSSSDRLVIIFGIISGVVIMLLNSV